MTLPVLHRLLLRLTRPAPAPQHVSHQHVPHQRVPHQQNPARTALDEALTKLQTFETQRPGVIQALDAGEADGEHGNPRLQHYRQMVTLALADVARRRMTPTEFAEQLETLALEDRLFSKFSHPGGEAG